MKNKKEQYDKIPYPYNVFLNNLKLEYAKKLICETNMTITDICFNAGFGSLSNFSRAFKGCFNMSANEMRKQHGKVKTKFYSEYDVKPQY